MISERRRLAAVASQLSFLACQLVAPAIIRFTAGRRDPFVRQWSSEALNLQIVWVVPWLLLGLAAERTQWNLVWFAGAGWFFCWSIYAIGCGCIGAVKSWRGERWRYPVSLRLVRDD